MVRPVMSPQFSIAPIKPNQSRDKTETRNIPASKSLAWIGELTENVGLSRWYARRAYPASEEGILHRISPRTKEGPSASRRAQIGPDVGVRESLQRNEPIEDSEWTLRTVDSQRDRLSAGHLD